MPAELRALWPEAQDRLATNVAPNAVFTDTTGIITEPGPGLRFSRYVHEGTLLALQIDYFFIEQHQMVLVLAVAPWTDPDEGDEAP